MIGDGMAMLLTRGFAARGGDSAAAEAMLSRFLQIYESRGNRLQPPLSGVAETLAALRRRGYRTAVCTNKPQAATAEVLRGVGLTGLFDGVAGGDRFFGPQARSRPSLRPNRRIGRRAEARGDDRRQRERRARGARRRVCRCC